MDYYDDDYGPDGLKRVGPVEGFEIRGGSKAGGFFGSLSDIFRRAASPASYRNELRERDREKRKMLFRREAALEAAAEFSRRKAEERRFRMEDGGRNVLEAAVSAADLDLAVRARPFKLKLLKESEGYILQLEREPDGGIEKAVFRSIHFDLNQVDPRNIRTLIDEFLEVHGALP